MIRTIEELRKLTGMKRLEFCQYFRIPYRTLQSWELGDRECPTYLMELIKYKLIKEGLVNKEDC